MIPLCTPRLWRANLIKNSRLRAVVGLFRDRASGSGQIEINDLPKAFLTDWDDMADDLRVLDKLAALSSFDVYSLRIELRNLNIPVADHRRLSLSAAKRVELTEYVRSFTRPLLEFVYGRADQRIADVSDILQMLSSPNRAEALTNLNTLASRLRISLHDLPKFLEEYGDIFLSLAYICQCLDHVVPDVHRFLAWLAKIRQMDQIMRDQPMQQLLDGVSANLTAITSSVTGRFESFDRRSQGFWTDINADSFRENTRVVPPITPRFGGHVRADRQDGSVEGAVSDRRRADRSAGSSSSPRKCSRVSTRSGTWSRRLQRRSRLQALIGHPVFSV
jgi:hypothetical protein